MDETIDRRGFEELTAFLAARGLRHAVVEHDQTYTAGAEARIAAVPPDHAAKAVMLRDDTGYVLAVVPASELLDVRKVRRLAARPELRLATEREMAEDFPHFEVGALPPFGELFDCPELIDVHLLEGGRILCNGGDHRHSIIVNARELWYASGARTGDLIAEHRGDDEPSRATRPSAR
jgi:Ala-tRNA(Pro) deacylase